MVRRPESRLHCRRLHQLGGSSMSIIRLTSLGLVAILAAACTQPGSSGPATFRRPPADHAIVAQSDLTESKNIDVMIDLKLLDKRQVPLLLPVVFTVGLPAAMDEAAPENSVPENSAAGNVAVTGKGADAADPLRFPGDVEDELVAAAGYVRRHFPAWRNMVGYLVQTPDKKYLLWATFDDSGGKRGLYFDITRWAEDRSG